MRIVLPASEGKRRARSAAPLTPAKLSFLRLNPTRERVLDALAEVSARPDAAAVLGVGPTLAKEVARNTRLREEPAGTAMHVYAGVLFDALSWTGLTTHARRRGRSRLVVISGLWGAVGPGDRIPAYRLPMDTDLPGVGPLAQLWRRELGPVLDTWASGHLIVDVRSAAYAAAWRPGPQLIERTVSVRILREIEGRRSTVSHMAKQARGLVVRHLLVRGGFDPSTPEQLAGAVGEAFDVELTPPTRRAAGWTLDVVIPSGF